MSSIDPATLAAWRFFDLNITYIIPSICGLGIITNLVCCIVFLLPKFELKIYKFLFWKSFFHLACLSIQVFTPYMYNNTFKFSTWVYSMWFRYWIYDACCMAALLCNLAVSFDRYIMISNKCKCFLSRIPAILLVVAFLVLSLLLFCFKLFAVYILPLDPVYFGEGSFSLQYTDWGNSYQYLVIRLAIHCIRDIVLWLVFVVTNCLLVYEARKVFRRKANLVGASAGVAAMVDTNIQSIAAITTNQHTTKSRTTAQPVAKSQSAQADSRLTKMTIVTSVVLAIGHMPNIYNIILYFFISNGVFTIGLQYTMHLFVNGLADDFMFLSFSLSAFFYYMFDKNFKATINDLVCEKMFGLVKKCLGRL